MSERADFTQTSNSKWYQTGHRVMSQPPTLFSYYIELIRKLQSRHPPLNMRLKIFFFPFPFAQQSKNLGINIIYKHVIKIWNWYLQRFVCGEHWRKWDESLLCVFVWSIKILCFPCFKKKPLEWISAKISCYRKIT